MAHGTRGIVDLRKRKAGASARAARARAQTELPTHPRLSLRARRRKIRALIASFAFVALWGAAYGLGELSYLPRYSIQGISVVGASGVPPKLVRSYVETKLNDGKHAVLSHSNMLLYPKTAIAEGIPDFFPRILSARVSRESLLARAITVTIAERQPFALWCEGAGNGQTTTETKCFEMDESGFIFMRATTAPTADRIIFTGGLATSSAPIGQIFLPSRFAEVRSLMARLAEEGFTAQSISVENEQDFSIAVSKGFVLRASFNQDASTLLRNLKVVLASEALRGKENKIEYIDLRFGNRVYYKAKSL